MSSVSWQSSLIFAHTHHAAPVWCMDVLCASQRLCKAMLVHRTVQSLDLPDNSLGDVGAAAIADLLEAGCKVTTLQLSDNDIGDVGMIRLAQVC